MPIPNTPSGAGVGIVLGTSDWDEAPVSIYKNVVGASQQSARVRLTWDEAGELLGELADLVLFHELASMDGDAIPTPHMLERWGERD